MKKCGEDVRVRWVAGSSVQVRRRDQGLKFEGDLQMKNPALSLPAGFS
eukprot:CAMPEP_0185844676 /NCGR_PEP_ID=MMETSP1354-20130828/802_1 /TAXON_ID=708628 /ORGANISM="Erythrolobus madagascarensis, Strain CCMP3276" /LENGTH=47 /DNA_ID= /DNA_START= /DNA_END= /DNA_ORIENTATION=